MPGSFTDKPRVTKSALLSGVFHVEDTPRDSEGMLIVIDGTGRISQASMDSMALACKQ